MPDHRPSSPPAAAHAQHDALLIAQQAAGDALEPAQAHEAERLIATCRACAELAADLRTVSKAVAWEPVPPRRRDYRIDPVRADALRGSAWSRLLRRLALPQARAVRPLAAGSLSLGLVLVIAGSVWPSADPSTSSQPAALTQASPAGVMGSDPGASPAAAVPPAELMVEAPAAAEDTMDDETTLSDVQEAPDAGRDSAAQELYASEAKASAAPLRERDAPLMERMDVAPSVATDTAAGVVGAMEPQAQDPGRAEPSSGAGLALEEAAPMDAEDGRAVAPADGDALEDRAAVTQELEASTADATSGSSTDFETIVIWVGVGLALAGALLLGLGWLSRRATDPLLR